MMSAGAGTARATGSSQEIGKSAGLRSHSRVNPLCAISCAREADRVWRAPPMSFDESVGGGVLSYGVSLANTAIATDGHGVLYAVSLSRISGCRDLLTSSLSAAARRTTSAAGADSV